MWTGAAGTIWTLAARANSHHGLRIRGHGGKTGGRRTAHVSWRRHHAWWRTTRWHRHHTRREATVRCRDARRRTHGVRSSSLRRMLTRPARGWHVLQAWRPLKWHRKGVRTLKRTGTTGSHRALATLRGERYLIKVPHGRGSVRNSPTELLTVRSLHICNSWIIEKCWRLLGTQSWGRTRHHFWQEARRRSDTCIRR